MLFVSVMLLACANDPSSESLSPSQDQFREEIEVLSSAEIEETVKQLALSDEERIWERIPWTRSIDEAKKISEDSQRPIFFFSMWGELDGRC
jgi:hypothetical protein